MVKIHQHVKFEANPSMHSLANARKPLWTDGRTHKTVSCGYFCPQIWVPFSCVAIGFCVAASVCPDPQNGVLWLLLSINLGVFFLCGYWVLCGCVCMSRPTKRCLVATFVHKFGCLFSCVAIGFVWLQINKIATKVPTVPKNSHRSGVL